MKLFLSAAIALFISSISFAHGNDKPGPHGGYIAMPGAYHTEVIPSLDQKSIKIYLLDINFKDLVSKEFNVSASFKIHGNTKDAACKTNEDFFECIFSEKILSKEGELIIRSNRLNTFDGVSTYKVPLRYN